IEPPQLILPLGTQVVTLTEVRSPTGHPSHPRGAVGVITQSPSDYWHSYRVKFPDGLEVSLRRQDLTVLSQYQSDIATPLLEYNLYNHVIYRCIIGSRAYGLSHDDSDTDRRGIYLPPAHLHWSLYGVPEQLDNPDNQEVYWELQKFIVLALKANPNILECLYTPLVEHASPLAAELLSMRHIFLSKLLYQTYNGYVLSQFKKLQADLRNKGEPKWKHVMHLIRLLLSGITALREAHVPVDVAEHRQTLLSIRRGEINFLEVEQWRLDLHKQFDQAAQSTPLPDKPDYARANEFLLKARQSAI
ncbi:MAG TPA: nucleotidyltransferase domain-containing protein, partial [Tepidisphaeraceae bacterium]|nr:nucleotidyltransferase domain-containing protein [Tepidisphaeraceae bacterium]